MGCGNSKISSSNIVILGVIQIMIGIYHVLMWYFLLLLYMGQIKGVFGSYEPLTYKMGTALWGLTFIISGAFTIKAANYQSRYMKLGREVSRILLFSYPLEFGIALTYSICSCSHLGRRQESNLESVTEVMSNSF
ncbi:membrane-spanning 4-domains subfamily A member 13 isoform X2 [Mesocricetus auratus]|uniref:Membrane-spanning 4-domains subfamily A member 13 isoform X2 n=1 Tax=Mesocricetus auratus TaxID=10036 RepID=A0A3Q0CYT0_MESAU|nr:membrane-spanning 4-domains subfamily A member 13 isoform X2 [Mesocricetus auratus]